MNCDSKNMIVVGNAGLGESSDRVVPEALIGCIA